MIGTGTIVNVALIAAGSLAGLAFGRLIKPRVQEGLMKATGLAVIFIGLAGALEGMLSIRDGALSTGSTVPMVVALAGGALLGELLDIEGWFERLGRWLLC